MKQKAPKKDRQRPVKKLFFLGILTFSLFPLSNSRAHQGEQEERPFPNSAFASIEGVRYHYRSFDAADEASNKGSILLIHGFGSSTFSWRKTFIPLTLEGYEVIAVDIPPFGFSDRSPDIDHSPSANAERLWELMERLGLTEPAIVGHSMGARVAGSMGALKPERSQAIFLVDGPFFGTSGRKWGRKFGAFLFNNRPFRHLFEKLGRSLAKKRGVIRKALAYSYGEKPGPETVDGYMRPLQKNGTGYSLPPYFLERSSSKLALEDLLTKVHLIWGEKDRIFSHRMPNRFLDRYPHRAELSVIQGSGHCPMETHPEAFLDVLIGALGQQKEE